MQRVQQRRGVGAYEVGAGLDHWATIVTKAEKTVGESREETGGEGSQGRVNRRSQSGTPSRNPRMQAHGGAMVETWQAEPGGRPTEMEPMVLETQAESRSQRERATQKVLETGTSGRDEAKVPEDWGGAGVPKDWGRAGGKVEGRVTDEGL